MNERILLDWALIYRDMGLCPIPLYRHNDPDDPSGNKRPMFFNWQNTTMPDDAMLARWFGDDHRNIGIVCGRSSGNLIVLDFDEFDAYIDWIETTDPPSTYTINTGGGGVHCYYRITEQTPGNRKLVGGDLRGQGGQVVAPPSVHVNGKTYEVRDASDIATVSLAELKLPYPVQLPSARPVRMPFATLNADAIVQTLANTPEGDRNNMLFRCACHLFDQGALLSQVESVLAPTALQIGLTRQEVRATIRSAKKRLLKPSDTQPTVTSMAAYLRHQYTARLDGNSKASAA